MIDRLVDRGIGIEVSTEFHTDALAPGYDAGLAVLARKVFGAVKGHVLQEMSQTALTGLLKDGPYTLRDIEVC